MEQRIQIAYLTVYDPKDKKNLSGTLFYLARALQEYVGDVHYIGPLKDKHKYLMQIKARLLHLLSGKIFQWFRTVPNAHFYAEQIAKKLHMNRYDLIFAPFGTLSTAYLDTDIPLVLYQDCTFASLLDFHPYYSSLHSQTIKDGHTIESQALQNASAVFFSSEWAQSSAIRDYGIDIRKCRVIPFGANLDEVPPKEKIHMEKTESCKLLFLAVDWQNKGGDIAFETMNELNKMKLKTELTVCGCIPPPSFSHKNMHVIPFLDKNKKPEKKKLDELLSISDYLILPSRAEAFGIAICEANAYGIPAITTNVGGLETAVKDDQNGFKLPLSARGFDYATIIIGNYQDDRRYLDLRLRSRQRYDEILNWQSAALSIKNAIKELLHRA